MNYLKSYVSYIKEDLQLAESIIKKKMNDYELLKKILTKNIGYLGKFTEYLMHENIPVSELKTTYDEILYLKSKNQNLNISEYNYEELLDEIEILKNKINFNGLVNQFPSEQKKLIKDNFGSSLQRIVLKLAKSKNLDIFLSKISRYKDFDSLINSMQIFCKDPQNNREQVKEIVKSMKSFICFENENILIIHIKSYEDIKILASDTSWCIVASESTYNSYTKGRSQFILYDYTKDEYDVDFKIGFTYDSSINLKYAYDVLDRGCAGKLLNIFNINNVKMSEVIYINNQNTDKIIIKDIDSVKKSSKVSDIIEFCQTCNFDIIPILIKKIFTLGKSETFKENSLKILLGRLYETSSYILQSELDKLYPNEKLFKFLSNRLRKLVVDKEFNDNLSDSAYEKGLEIWSDSGIYNNFGHGELRQCLTKGDKLILKLSDRLNKIYSTNIKYNDILIHNKPSKEFPQYKGFRLSKELDSAYVILNFYLKRPEVVKNFDEIKDKLITSTKDQENLMKLPIDINRFHSNIEDITDINKVIKKDMTISSFIFYNKHGNYTSKLLDKYDKFIEYMDGYKIMFKISKREMNDQVFKYELGKNTGTLSTILKKFPRTNGNVRKGSTLTDGNIKIDVY